MEDSIWASLAVPSPLQDRGIDQIYVFRTPMRIRFRDIDFREGLLLHGPHGWGECSPFWNYDPRVSARWLRAGLEVATQPLPTPLRHSVAINATIPITTPQDAYDRVLASGCHTVKVKVAGANTSLAQDCDRIAAVHSALSELHSNGTITQAGRIRVDANAAWDVEQACEAIKRYDRAAGMNGLDYVEQPCRNVSDLAAVRRRVQPRIAADEAIRLSDDPLAVKRAEAADIAIVKLQPLGGPSAVLELVERLDLPVVVSSALDTAVGIHAAATLAASLPELGDACGLGTVTLLSADVVEPRYEPQGGVIKVQGNADRPQVSFPHWHSLEGMNQADGTDIAAISLTQRWQERLTAMVSYV